MIGDDDDKKLCSDCSRRNCTCPRKSVSDSGFDEHMSDDNVSDDKGDSGDDDRRYEDKEANAVVENFRTFFTKINSPPAKTLPIPQWAGTNNEENPRSLSLGSRVIHVNQLAWTNSMRDDTDEARFGASTSVYSMQNINPQITKNSNQPPSNMATIGNGNATSRDSTTVAEFFKHFAYSGSQSNSYQTAPVASGSNVNTKFNPFY